MNILTRVEFLKLPNGSLYSKYSPMGMIDGLYRKGDTWGNDWLYNDLIGEAITCEDSELSDLFDKAEKGGKFELDLHSGRRDGNFEDNAMFAVYDRKDIFKLIGRLSGIVYEVGA